MTIISNKGLSSFLLFQFNYVKIKGNVLGDLRGDLSYENKRYYYKKARWRSADKG